MNTRTAHHNASSSHKPLWCDEHNTAHNGTHDDARGILGDAGTVCGVSYRWDSRRGGYNLVSPMSVVEAQRVALASLTRVVNARYMGRTPRMPRYRSRSIVCRDVRTTTNNARVRRVVARIHADWHMQSACRG